MELDELAVVQSIVENILENVAEFEANKFYL